MASRDAATSVRARIGERPLRRMCGEPPLGFPRVPGSSCFAGKSSPRSGPRGQGRANAPRAPPEAARPSPDHPKHGSGGARSGPLVTPARRPRRASARRQALPLAAAPRNPPAHSLVTNPTLPRHVPQRRAARRQRQNPVRQPICAVLRHTPSITTPADVVWVFAGARREGPARWTRAASKKGAFCERFGHLARL